MYIFKKSEGLLFVILLVSAWLEMETNVETNILHS